jgi:hypothetical protein
MSGSHVRQKGQHMLLQAQPWRPSRVAPPVRSWRAADLAIDTITASKVNLAIFPKNTELGQHIAGTQFVEHLVSNLVA